MTEAKIKRALEDAKQHLDDGFITRKEYVERILALQEKRRLLSKSQ